jgi:cytoskeletal protein CcmA (bactofilin family)
MPRIHNTRNKEQGMDTSAHIGPSIRIKGDITAKEPLTIAGHVEGSISAQGHPVTIVEGGLVTATVEAQTIIVSGTVKGHLIADARIVVRETAVIEGDIAAPAVSLVAGGTVNGRIETATRASKLQLAS